MRRSSSGIFLVCAALIFWACRESLLAVDTPPSDQPSANQAEKPTRKIHQSDKAVVKNVVYGLEEEGGRLYLTSQPLDGVDRQLKRQELEFDPSLDGQDGQVVELSLAKLNGKNLMAVVKVRHGEEYDFHCLTFIAAPGGHVRDQHRFFTAKFFSTRDDFKILAVGGKHFEGSVFIVLGELDSDVKKNRDLVSVTSGTFYFSGCPWPPSDGILTPFRVESVIPVPKH